MATVKLGAFVTGIAGSIQGTTFRRNRGNVIMQSNPRGGSNSKLLQNKNLIKIAELGQLWNALSSAKVTSWADYASVTPTTDKWGAVRYLTPREMFYKLSGSLIPLNLPPPDPDLVESDIPTIDIYPSANATPEVFNIEFLDSLGAGYVIFQAEKTRNRSKAATFTRRKILKVMPLPLAGDINCIDILQAISPVVSPGEIYFVYYRIMNNFGVRGVFQYSVVEIV